MKDVVELDIRSGEKNFIDAKNLAKKAIQDKIKEKYGKVGLKVEISKIKDSEQFIDSYYSNNGYEVVRCKANSGLSVYCDNKDESLIKNYFRNQFKKAGCLTDKGVPDFLVFEKTDDEINELFFVEAKSSKDGLRPSQLNWMFSENPEIPVKVCYTNPEDTLVEEADT